MALNVAVDGRLFVSAQENINVDHYDRWLTQLASSYPGFTRSTIGHSVGGRPIWAAQTNPGAANVLVFVGRQHPPEVTGAIAMLAFVDRLMEYHPNSCRAQLQCAFYKDTNFVFVPLLNPDGVVAGHWRHNLNGVDINRDWKAASQPEIQAVLALIDELSSQASLRLLFDFHSTYRNVFYTQDAGYTTSPRNFADEWLARGEAKGTYEIENAYRRTTQLGTSKNYIHQRFGVPGITYELGDETPRHEIRDSARALADAMVETLYPYPQALDLLIAGGTVVDGSGTAGQILNVGIHGDRIVYIGNALPAAARVVDASGLLVTPGFIDPHTHTVRDLRTAQTAANKPYLYQGVTTVFTGNDGDGKRFVDEAARIRAAGPGTNVGLWRGHNALRRSFVGDEDRQASEVELEAMSAALEEDLKAGALGLSTGLFYAPGSFAPTSEVVALAKVAARNDRHYDSHIRDESTYNVGLLAAVQEVIDISREAEIPAHIAHIKALGPQVAGQAQAVVELINNARAEGLEISADQYPWLASGTRISNALLPRSIQAGGRAATLARIDDLQQRGGLVRAMGENLKRRGGADRLLVTGQSPHRGQTLAEVAVILGVSVELAALELVRQGDPAIASFMMNEADVSRFMSEPWVVTGSDGSPGHPRKYGTFPHKYQKYVREQSVLSLEAFVHRSSGLTAEIFNLCDRGTIELSKKADIAVWHPERFQSRASYESPEALATGVEYLFVNGELAIDGGALTDQRSGQVIYAQDCP